MIKFFQPIFQPRRVSLRDFNDSSFVRLRVVPTLQSRHYSSGPSPQSGSSKTSEPPAANTVPPLYQKPKKDKIVIPNRINREPTAILKALASTVGQDYTAPHYRYHDDPYLIPMSKLSKRNCILSKESGKKAAKWIKHKHADPLIAAFSPNIVITDETPADEETVALLISQGRLADVIKVYDMLKSKGAAISPATTQSLLEFISFYNEAEPLDEDLIEERWFSSATKGRDRLRNTWKPNGVAERLFRELEKPDATAYCSLIRGRSKFYQAEKPVELLKEAQEKGLTIDTDTYNSILRVVCFVRQSSEMRWQLGEAQNVRAEFVRIGWKIWTTLESQEAGLGKKIYWTGRMLGDLLGVTVRGGHYDKGCEVVKKLSRPKQGVVGAPEIQSLRLFLEEAIKEGDGAMGLACLQYVSEAGYGEINEMADDLRSKLPLDALQMSRLQNMVGFTKPEASSNDLGVEDNSETFTSSSGINPNDRTVWQNYPFVASSLSSIRFLSLLSANPLACVQKRALHRDEMLLARNEMLYLHLRGQIKKKRPIRKPLGGAPFLKGVVLKTLIKKPKKPNSANRKCVLVRLSNGKEAVAYVPGIGHNLQEHNIVLVRCGRLQDVPGVKLRCVRGVYDLPHVVKQQPAK